MTVDCRNAAEIRPDSHFGRRVKNLVYLREDSKASTLVEGSHDGYLPLNGMTHRRRLFLSEDGHDLRGEETLSCSVGLSRPQDIAVRFHVHPRVMVSPIRDGEEVLLRLPGGAGWRFRHSGGLLALEDSIYLGAGSRPRKTKQLVIYGQMQKDSARIKWALQKEGL